MSYLYRSSTTHSDYLDRMRAMCVYSSYQTNPNLVFSTHFLSLYPVKGFPIEFETIAPIPETQCKQRDRKKNPGNRFFIDPIEEEIRVFLGEKECKISNSRPLRQWLLEQLFQQSLWEQLFHQWLWEQNFFGGCSNNSYWNSGSNNSCWNSCSKNHCWNICSNNFCGNKNFYWRFFQQRFELQTMCKLLSLLVVSYMIYRYGREWL